MSEYFNDDEIDQIIQYNKNIVESRGDIFEVEKELLFRVFWKVNNIYEQEIDRKTRIIKKTAKILAGITFNQPFHDGNKETAILVAIMFLNRTGFDISLTNKKEKRTLYNLLIKTVEKFPDDPTIYQEIEEYLQQEIIKII